MRVTAMVLGIIWGLFLMFYALYVFFAGELTSAVGMGDKSLSMLGSVLTPILVFVGAGLESSTTIDPSDRHGEYSVEARQFAWFMEC